jgi:hypothetical protein
LLFLFSLLSPVEVEYESTTSKMKTTDADVIHEKRSLLLNFSTERNRSVIRPAV